MDKRLKKYKNDIDKIVRIQKIVRGFLVRKQLKKVSDNFTFEFLKKILDQYIKYADTVSKINKNLANKKIRMPNFPSEISENIVKYAIYKKYKVYPSWDTIVGDLIIYNKFINKKIEVKAFSSDGPTTFGPTEKWDYIYFVDATKYKQQYFIVYEIKLSNNSETFSNIKLNKTETFRDQCNQKRRPRICFNDLKKQIKDHISVIYDGSINSLFP